MKKYLFLFFTLLSICGYTQKTNIQIGKTTIALNEYFTIALKVEGQNIQSYSGFPSIEGFNKRGTSSSSSVNFINGRTSSSRSITQNYQAVKEGTFKLPPFTITLNGKKINSTGATITVGPAKQQKRRRSAFDDFFGGSQQPQEYVEVEDDAFFAIASNKKEIYEGEGVTISGAFYIPESQRNLFSSTKDLSQQIQDIKANLTPKQCWEESFDIQEVQAERTTLNGMNYLKFVFFKSTYYPLNDNDLVFPSQNLKMIKYKIAKQRSFWGNNAQETFKTFQSKTKHIKVKRLPPHPLRDRVAVGDYKLIDKVDKSSISTNESIKYNISIYGEGNISAISIPELKNNDSLTFFKPTINSLINRNDDRVTGSREFSYDIIPNEPGFYSFKDQLSFIYFNVRTEKYDTLYPKVILNVIGESRKNASISNSDLGPFYDSIDLEDNNLLSRTPGSWLKLIANISILTAILAIVFVVIKK